MKKIIKKNQIMISALAIMIGVAGYLNFAGAKIGEQDFLSSKTQDLMYKVQDISDEDTYALSLKEDNFDDFSDIVSLDQDGGYYADNYSSDDMLNVTNEQDGLLEDSQNSIQYETPGEALYTSTTTVNSLAGARLLKEQTRAQNKDTLLEIINNETINDEAKSVAIQSMIAITDIAQKETEAEMLLEAKGFTQAVVSIGDNSADVMIEASSLTESQTAQIMDIVQRKTNISPENIIITVSSSR